MQRDLPRIRILAVFLAIIFLGAQLHFCADLSAGPASSHMCPVCSAANSAVTTPTLLIAIVSIPDRWESRGYSRAYPLTFRAPFLRARLPHSAALPDPGFLVLPKSLRGIVL